jgi:hypothetical protein
VATHERKHLARIGRELQLEEFLPHLFLGTAEDRDVAGKAERLSDHVRAEAKDFIDSFQNLSTLADHIAEIDHAVAGLQTLGKAIVECGEAIGLAMNRRDGPNATGPSQYRIDWRIAGS